MRIVSIKLAGSLLAIAAVAAPASAYDRKNYPGIACMASGTTNSNVARSATTGRAFNQSTTQLALACPAVKDVFSVTAGLAWVIDQNPTSGDNVQCWLRAGRPDSLAIDFATDTTGEATATFSSPNPVRLDFGDVDGVTDGFYWMRCDVPGAFGGAQSGVVMYQIDEAE